MKLSQRALKDLREMIEDKINLINNAENAGVIKKNEEGIKLNKELLEMLLFKPRVIDGKTIKIPVWSGNFLRRLDLSEVNTDNIMWSTTRIDYRNTNIKIDFSKSYWLSNKNMNNYNFEGVDLSSSNIDVIDSFLECNLKNTNIKITSVKELSKFEKCILTNNDLSDVTITTMELFSSSVRENTFINTGLKIFYTPEYDKEFSSELAESIKKGKLDGCYINGVKILSKEEKEQIKEEKRKERSLLEEKAKAYVLKQFDDYKKSN